MNKANRKKLVGSGLYIVLAACVLSAMTINVVNMFSKDSVGNSDPVDSNVPGITDTEQKNETENKTDLSSGTTVKPFDRGDIGIVNGPSVKEPEKDTEKEDEGKDSSSEMHAYGYIKPVDGQVSEYDPNILRYSQTMNDYRRHEGVDISAELGDEVCAFASGTVSQIYTDPYMGKTVVIEHDGGLSSRYANLSDAVVPELQVGSTVNVGDVIGLVGDTAMVECGEEPHLHFEVFYNGESIDPIAYFEDTK